MNYTKEIREIATRLLENEQVDMVMAWEKGDLEYQTVPFIARTVDEVSRIVCDEYSIHNLSNSLLRFRDGQEKIAIVVKGCDSRGVVRLLEDNQFPRERLYIIGVACPGVKDPLLAMKQNSGFEKVQDQDEGLASKCRYCLQPNPVIYDELVGEEQPLAELQERFARIEEIEQMSADERYKFFEDMISTCIRCYACRQVCVACNCRTCIFDETRPQWVGRETNISDNMMYHLIRASHMAGRCVECGECERVCPVNIPLMLINRKLIKDVNGFFGPYEAGMEYVEGRKPPLSVYKENDPDDFL
jgi:formate dehydrogenase subunit beta